MAYRHGDPGLIGFTQFGWALQLMRFTARGRASRVLTAGIDELGRSVRLSSEDTLCAEMLGMMHLLAAQCAARDKQHDDARAHLDEAGQIAARIGECNGLRMHFGPTNVAVWRLGIGVELGEGGRVYEEATRTPLDVAALNSQERSAALHFDLARALVQDGARRRGDPASGCCGPAGPDPDPQRPDRPGPDPHPEPAGPPPSVGTGQPTPPLRHPRARLTPLCISQR
ncbi:MAG: hypothetical protein M3460_05610 [Actinomycetota bacterium]|nr:hypothetical protein [Actinomycetota bacterium]